jgi:hypothetical protein
MLPCLITVPKSPIPRMVEKGGISLQKRARTLVGDLILHIHRPQSDAGDSSCNTFEDRSLCRFFY